MCGCGAFSELTSVGVEVGDLLTPVACLFRGLVVVEVSVFSSG